MDGGEKKRLKNNDLDPGPAAGSSGFVQSERLSRTGVVLLWLFYIIVFSDIKWWRGAAV